MTGMFANELNAMLPKGCRSRVRPSCEADYQTPRRGDDRLISHYYKVFAKNSGLFGENPNPAMTAADGFIETHDFGGIEVLTDCVFLRNMASHSLANDNSEFMLNGSEFRQIEADARDSACNLIPTSKIWQRR